MRQEKGVTRITEQSRWQGTRHTFGFPHGKIYISTSGDPSLPLRDLSEGLIDVSGFLDPLAPCVSRDASLPTVYLAVARCGSCLVGEIGPQGVGTWENWRETNVDHYSSDR